MLKAPSLTSLIASGLNGKRITESKTGVNRCSNKNKLRKKPRNRRTQLKKTKTPSRGNGKIRDGAGAGAGRPRGTPTGFFKVLKESIMLAGAVDRQSSADQGQESPESRPGKRAAACLAIYSAKQPLHASERAWIIFIEYPSDRFK